MPRRNTAPAPTHAPHTFREAVRAFAPALTLCLTGLTVACADGPTAPGAHPSAALGAALSPKDAALDANGDGKVDKAERGPKAGRDLTKAELDSLRADWRAYKEAVKHGAVADLLRCEPQEERSATHVFGPKGGTLKIGPHSFEIPAGALDSDVVITATAPTRATRELQFEPHGLHFNKPVAMTIDYRGCILPDSIPPGVVYVGQGRQVLEQMPAHDDHALTKITALTDHFSGYLMSTGRQ